MRVEVTITWEDLVASSHLRLIQPTEDGHPVVHALRRALNSTEKIVFGLRRGHVMQGDVAVKRLVPLQRERKLVKWLLDYSVGSEDFDCLPLKATFDVWEAA